MPDLTSGSEPEPLVAGPFGRLPDEIVEQILRTADPNVFASLILLNRKWRDVSQQSDLYLRQLAACPAYAARPSSLPEPTDENLAELRRLFARQVKRNLFEAYRRPSQTIIKLVSTSISSASCPGGEGMQFSASPHGQLILAYNSSRIYVIDVRRDSYEIKRELKPTRRPVAACIKDDGLLLAVLSTALQVDLYSLEASPPRRKQSILLDNTSQAIALSPCGSVLAAAHDSGIEVFSLVPGALATDKRAVKCDSVDALCFSFDGTQILGTTVQSASPSTVVLTAPYFDPGSQAADNNICAMWTTSILFPNSSRDCSHAVLLQDGLDEEASWVFTYDRSFETFRAVRVEDLRNGTTYFTGPIPQQASHSKLLPSTLPAATFHGDLVASGFCGRDVWIHGIPEHLEAVAEVAAPGQDPPSSPPGLARQSSSRSSLSRHPSTRTQEASRGAVPQWQILGDKLRNTFVAGFEVLELSGASSVKWVAGFGDTSMKERLVVGARGVSGPQLATGEGSVDFVDGGRIALLDFDYGLSDGTKQEVTIEVGADDAEELEEEQRDLETEVAIVRRRTVVQNRGNRSTLLRSATARAVAAPREAALPSLDDAHDDPLLPRSLGASGHRPPAMDAMDDGDAANLDEQEALDAPYAHASPRSGNTLRRAATAAAVNRRLNPTLADGRPVAYRRADGRAEHPHESDADNWVPPPPPYQKDDPGTLPAFLRGNAILAPAQLRAPPAPLAPSTPTPTCEEKDPHRNVPRAVLYSEIQHKPEDTYRPFPPRRRASDSTMASRPRITQEPRPLTSPGCQAGSENLYDASPHRSPSLTDAAPALPRQAQFECETANVSSSAAASPHGEGGDGDIPSGSQRGDNDRGAVPTLVLQVRQQDLQSADVAATTPLPLLTAQTWRTGTVTEPTGLSESTGPHSAPVSKSSGDESSFALPPLPTAAQLASLSKRISQGSPRRLSAAGLPSGRVPVGGRRVEERQRTRTSAASSRSVWPSEPEPPLIISTPGGVTGAFDPPGQGLMARVASTPILAPTPRHPRPHSAHSRPTVERLETIYSLTTPGLDEPGEPSVDSHHQQQQQQQQQQPAAAWHRRSRVMSALLPRASASSSPTLSSTERPRGRADTKSAAWSGRRGAKAKGEKKGIRDTAARGGASGAGSMAMDTAPSRSPARPAKERDKKCVMM